MSLFLYEDHELTILLVQSILRVRSPPFAAEPNERRRGSTLAPTLRCHADVQQDLESPNHIDVCSALSVLTALASKEIIPALLPAVQACLQHPKCVRKGFPWHGADRPRAHHGLGL